MPIALMPEKRQLEIVEAVKVAADLVATGRTPTEAVVKAAGEISANEHELQRMTEAYNTSATLAHMRTSSEKSASFPLVDFEAAKLSLFPEGAKVARAVRQAGALEIPDLRTAKVGGAREQELSDYLAWGMQHSSRFPTGMVTPEVIATDPAFQSYKNAKATKTAGARDDAPQRDLDSLKIQALRECEHWKKVASEHALAAQEHRLMASNAMHKIATAFRHVDRPDWTRFEGEVLAVHGKEASEYLEAIWAIGGLGSVRCTRAEGPVKVAYVDDRTELHKLFRVFKLACEITSEFKANEKEALERYESDRRDVLEHMKVGMMMTGMNPMFMAAQLAGTFDGTLPQPSPSKADINPNVGMESELNKARLQAVVRDMMTSDDVIAQHAGQDPAKVVKIVEQLAQVHPKILDMPSVLQSGVRKALELGSIEPFELKQLQSLGEPTSPAPKPQG